MSLSITRGEGVTVMTLNTDPSSAWPPLCQILKGLCYSPLCCSKSQRLRTVQKSSQSLLGALHILTGLFSLTLAVILSASGMLWWSGDCTASPFWLGGLFVSFGVVSILSEKFPSPCMVVLNVVLQLSGVGFSVAAVVLHAINLVTIDLWELCENLHFQNDDEFQQPTEATPPAQVLALQETCGEVKGIIEVLLVSISAVLIVLSVLELCLTVSSSILGIQSLRSLRKNRDQGSEDPETYKPLVA